jgi:transposase
MCSRIQIGAALSENLPDMAFLPKLNEGQWAEARRLRAGGASFADIAKQFGLSKNWVATRARREQWGTPLAAEPRKPRGKTAVLNEFKQERLNLSRRIIKIIELDLRMMEQRMLKRLQDADAGPAEGLSNDELKRLGTLKQTIQEHTEFSPDTEPTAGGAGTARSADQAATSEADVFRREIAERLEKLLPPS